jgi:hypothetical protein
MVINASEECRRRVFSDHLDQEVCPTRVLFNEAAHVMNEARDENERALLGLLLDCRSKNGEGGSTFI